MQANKNIDSNQLAREISYNLQEEFIEKLSDVLNNGYENNAQIIEELKNEIIGLREELTSKERDVLICENAKLKMRVKEKSYEVAELKEKVKRFEHSEGFLQKIFKKTKEKNLYAKSLLNNL